MNKITKTKKIINEAEPDSIMGVVHSINKASRSGYFKSLTNRTKTSSEQWTIKDYQAMYTKFFKNETLPVDIQNKLITFNLNDEIEYIRCQLSDELDYEHLYDEFFAKPCLVKIWSETLFYTLFNSIKNSSVTQTYGTSADDYDWGSFEFIETERRSKYKESLFAKYNLSTFLDDAYMSNNRIYFKLEPKFAERLRFLVGNDSENWIINCLKKQFDNFILDNRLIVNWEPAI